MREKNTSKTNELYGFYNHNNNNLNYVRHTLNASHKEPH